jgi:hypothetical protein
MPPVREGREGRTNESPAYPLLLYFFRLTGATSRGSTSNSPSIPFTGFGWHGTGLRTTQWTASSCAHFDRESSTQSTSSTVPTIQPRGISSSGGASLPVILAMSAAAYSYSEGLHLRYDLAVVPWRSLMDSDACTTGISKVVASF